jgi:hypothetical protein
LFAAIAPAGVARALAALSEAGVTAAVVGHVEEGLGMVVEASHG